MDADMLDEPRRSGGTGRLLREREAILAAASEVFLRSGYHGATMDEITMLSGVSKHIVSVYFTSMRELFEEVVPGMTIGPDDLLIDDLVLDEKSDPTDSEGFAAYLRDYGYRQLRAALTPHAVQRRRLATGEEPRSPGLAKGNDEHGAMSAQAALAASFERLADRGLLGFKDSMRAACDFHFLITSSTLQMSMEAEDYGIPEYGGLHGHVDSQVHFFLLLYGPDSTWWARRFWTKGPIICPWDVRNKPGGTSQ